MLQKLHKENFDKVYEIMEEAFPPDERRSYDEQKALLSNPNYRIYVLKDAENKDIKAFIAIYQFEKFTFIEHFATNSAYRNQGIGAFVLRELSALLQCKMCLEVEMPETKIAQRRIEFYKRNGFYVNEFEYIQPPISKGKKSIPMLIMTFGEAVSENEFVTIKDTVYRNVYGILNKQ